MHPEASAPAQGRLESNKGLTASNIDLHCELRLRQRDLQLSIFPEWTAREALIDTPATQSTGKTHGDEKGKATMGLLGRYPGDNIESQKLSVAYPKIRMLVRCYDKHLAWHQTLAGVLCAYA